MYKDKIEKIKRIGTLKENNLDEAAAKELMLKIFNATIGKKRPVADLSTTEMEALIRKLKGLYNIYIGYILPVTITGPEIYYSLSLRKRNDHLDTVFARNIYEGMFKSLLVLYYISKQEDK